MSTSKSTSNQTVHRRKDLLTGRWVTVVPQGDDALRGLIADWQTPAGLDTASHYESWCYYCRGNEHNTNGDIDLLQTPAGRIRVTTKKNLDVSVKNRPDRWSDGAYDAMTAYGADETVILGDIHNARLSTINPLLLAEGLRMCGKRITDLTQDPNLKNIIFWTDGNNTAKRHGYVHPQFHVSSEATILQRTKEEMMCSIDHFGRKERCVVCDIIREEEQHSSEQRLIIKSDHLVVISPYASRHPFELMILPRKHCAHFEQLGQDNFGTGAIFSELTNIIQNLLKRLEVMLGERFVYSLVMHNGPKAYPGHEATDIIANVYHCYLRLKPLLRHRSIEEDATGERTNLVPPETATHLLKLTSEEYADWLAGNRTL